jgi:hypothetical protein
MIDTIEKEFSYLIERGYQVKIQEITYVFKYVVYFKPNIKIIFKCELVEKQFDFEIWVKSGDKEYSICEWTGRTQFYYQNQGVLNIIHKNIFEYTVGFWDEKTFQNRKEEIYKKKYGFNRGKKIFLEFVSLYKELLVVAVKNIEIFFDIH